MELTTRSSSGRCLLAQQHSSRSDSPLGVLCCCWQVVEMEKSWVFEAAPDTLDFK